MKKMNLLASNLLCVALIILMGISLYSQSEIKNAEIKTTAECEKCKDRIEKAVNKLDGILRVAASYELGNAVVEFDNTKTGIQEIQQAINSTGYSVTNKTEK